jgi:hypothetical protein
MVALLFVVLWVRSYWHADSLTRVDNNFVLSRLGMNCGVFFFVIFDDGSTPSLSPPEITVGWEYQEYDPPNADVSPWMFQNHNNYWG